MDSNNNNNKNTVDSAHGAVFMTYSLQEFTQFILWM